MVPKGQQKNPQILRLVTKSCVPYKRDEFYYERHTSCQRPDHIKMPKILKFYTRASKNLQIQPKLVVDHSPRSSKYVFLLQINKITARLHFPRVLVHGDLFNNSSTGMEISSKYEFYYERHTSLLI